MHSIPLLVIIEADICSAATNKSKDYMKHVGGNARHIILTTCGDDKVKRGTTHVDPALCLYMGKSLICTIDNNNLTKRAPRGNSTLCCIVGIELKENQTSYKWKNYYSKKVWTVSHCIWFVILGVIFS